jgi:hypothetical protein
MSDRVRAEPGLRSASNAQPSLEDVRRKLEGRWETIEAAQSRYAALEALLSGVAWKVKVRREPGLMREVLSKEAALAEALPVVRRRAEAEGWPEETPALVTVREVTTRRARLETLVRERLASLAPPSGEPSLAEDLARLEGLVLQPIPLAPATGEVRLLQHTKQDPNQGPLVLRLYLFLLMAAGMVLVGRGVGGELGAYTVMGLAFALLSWFVSNTGEYWLTSERLVWRPVVGEPVAVPLRSIPAGGVKLDRTTSSVRVDGERTARLRFVSDAERLAAHVEMHRQAPFLGASRAGLRLGDAAYYPATLREGATERKGLAVLRPGFAVFLPEGTGRAVLEAVTGAPVAPGLRVEVDWVVDQLRWLPDAEFDAAIERAARAVGGVRWASWEAKYRADVPVWRDIRITLGAQVLSGKVDWAQQAPAEKVLGTWPR